MALLTRYPVLARVSCETCQKFMLDYDWQTHTGTGKVKRCGGGQMDQPRIVPPPCRSDPDRCPKGSPEQEHEHVLSDKNWQALSFYRRVEATHGRCLTDEAAQDGIVQHNLAIIDRLMREARQERLAESIAAKLPILRRA